MNHQEFSQLLARNQIPSVLFFEGSEEHLKQNALRELRARLLPEGLEELNESRLNAPETDELIAAAETLPFMADRRLILLRDHPAIVGRGEADEKLLQYLPSAPPTAVILFYCVLPVKQKKIKNAVQKLGGVVEFKPLSARELTTWVTKAFKDQGRECDERTADFLIFTCGTDMNQLLTEIAKISAYHPDHPAIHPDDIRALATPSAESKVFRMVDHVVAGEDAKAFSVLRDLLLHGESRVGILFMLMRQYRILQQIKIMQYEKKQPRQIEDALGIRGYFAQQYFRQAASYTGAQVKAAVHLCLDTEADIKSGLLREEGALEAVMLKLLLLRKK